jgi:chemotaxis protein MotA
MDLATILGLSTGLGCIFWSIISGGGAAIFFNVPSLLITVGGMVSATFINFSMSQVVGVFSVMRKSVFCKLPREQDLIQKMVNYAAINRRDGALALEQQLPGAGDGFLVKAMQMVIDGQDEAAIEKQLGLEIQYLQERHSMGKKIIEFMGSSAPAWGMIGTLIGLVQMLQSLNDPSQIGSGMAVSLITTFYGSFLANLLFLPMAGKLGIRSKQEAQLREMIMEGVIAIVRGDSPTVVRERMQAFISYARRADLRPRI